MQSMLPLITGSAGALVVLALWVYAFFTGKLHSDSEFQKLVRENEKLKEALTDERRAVDEAVRTGTVTNQLITALTRMAESRQALSPQVFSPPPTPSLGLTGEDLGL